MTISSAEVITSLERRRGGRWMRGSGLLQHRARDPLSPSSRKDSAKDSGGEGRISYPASIAALSFEMLLRRPQVSDTPAAEYFVYLRNPPKRRLRKRRTVNRRSLLRIERQ